MEAPWALNFKVQSSNSKVEIGGAASPRQPREAGCRWDRKLTANEREWTRMKRINRKEHKDRKVDGKWEKFGRAVLTKPPRETGFM
jgi:hypothetical protein